MFFIQDENIISTLLINFTHENRIKQTQQRGMYCVSSVQYGPLSAIASYTEMLLSETKGLLTNEQIELLRRTRTSTERIEVDDYVKRIYQKLQHYGQKRQINWNELLEKHRTPNINFFQVRQLLREVDPTITSHEVKILFDHMDSQKKGVLPFDELKEKLLQIDYRSQNNVIDRKVDELVGIIRQIKADPRAIFEKIDLNKSGQLDFSEFSRFIK